jgi:hypothetical protein
LRKDGSTEEPNLPVIRGGAFFVVTEPWPIPFHGACPAIVECNDGIFEVKLQTGSGTPANIVFKVDLIGYFT